jgi:hypothetical protein
MSDNQQLFIICWHSVATGYEGEGTSPVTKSVGEAWVSEQNKKWPELRHWLRPYTEKKAIKAR